MDYKQKISTIKQQLQPYTGVIRFMVVLLVAHFFWKLTIVGDEGINAVSWFGYDISAPFVWMSAHITNVVCSILTVLGFVPEKIGETTIHFANGHGAHIVWACTGLKQTFIFCCILLFSRGPWRHKSWFVPMGVVACYIINILRITLLTMVIYWRAEWFNFLHEYVSKYLFYFIIFLIWVWWEEKFNNAKEGSKPLEKQK